MKMHRITQYLCFVLENYFKVISIRTGLLSSVNLDAISFMRIELVFRWPEISTLFSSQSAFKEFLYFPKSNI